MNIGEDIEARLPCTVGFLYKHLYYVQTVSLKSSCHPRFAIWARPKRYCLEFITRLYVCELALTWSSLGLFLALSSVVASFFTCQSFLEFAAVNNPRFRAKSLFFHEQCSISAAHVFIRGTRYRLGVLMIFYLLSNEKLFIRNREFRKVI